MGEVEGPAVGEPAAVGEVELVEVGELVAVGGRAAVAFPLGGGLDSFELAGRSGAAGSWRRCLVGVVRAVELQGLVVSASVCGRELGTAAALPKQIGEIMLVSAYEVA